MPDTAPDAAPEGAPVVLGFDCSGPWCAVAVIRGGAVLACVQEDMARGQAERLMPLAESVLAQAGVAWRDLSAIGVGTGPGNFTGIRIAVAAARGLALSLDVPAIGVGACEAAAFALPRPCRVILPARAGTVFWQDFLTDTLPPIPGLPDQDVAEALRPGPPVASSPVPLAEAVARIAAARLPQAPLPRPAPVYLRPADAAPPADPPPRILPG